jgi:MFS family permease
MHLRNRPYLTFLALAIGAFAFADIGFEIFARVWIDRNTIGKATSETLYYWATQPTGTAMLLAPFLLLGWMAASLARKRTFNRGLLLFGIGVVALGALYFVGHIGAEQAMHDRKWTAAALSVGLLPFQSIPVLFLALVTRLLMGRRQRESAI